jgi:hypothetical protein
MIMSTDLNFGVKGNPPRFAGIWVGFNLMLLPVSLGLGQQCSPASRSAPHHQTLYLEKHRPRGEACAIR